MALATYADLQAAIANYLARPGDTLVSGPAPDFVSLAERITHIELKLDDLDAGLDRIEKLLAKPIAARTATPAPARRSKRKGAK